MFCSPVVCRPFLTEPSPPPLPSFACVCLPAMNHPHSGGASASAKPAAGDGEGPAGAGSGADDAEVSDALKELLGLKADKPVVHKQRGKKGQKRERPVTFKDDAHFISMEPERMAVEVRQCVPAHP